MDSRPEQPRRVPDCDIVDVGSQPSEFASSEPVDVRDLVLPRSKKPRARASRQNTPGGRRNLTRPLLALLALELMMYGGFYFSKRYADSQVIVVPAPATRGSVIT